LPALAAGHDGKMAHPPREEELSPDDIGAYGFCRNLEAVGACEAEVVSGDGLASEACFAFVMRYGAGVLACEVGKIAERRVANKMALVTHACKAGLRCVGKPVTNHNSLAAAAQLVVFDAMDSQTQMLSLPDSFSSGVLEPLYADGNAKTVLLPFTCADFWWSHRMELFAFSAEYSIAGDKERLAQASICNRYTAQSRELDTFVAEHPDLVIVVAAGDGGSAPRSVSAPGTCKNCLTIGSVQSWPEELLASIDLLPTVCRDVHCPQTSAAAHAAQSSSANASCYVPTPVTPDCCGAKFTSLKYAPDRLHDTSARGPAVTAQATPALAGADGDFYR